MYDWLLNEADLGYGSHEEEEEAWRLMQQLRQLQAFEVARPGGPPPPLQGQGGRSGGDAQPVPLPEQFQEYERIAWAPGPGRGAEAQRPDGA